MVTYFIGLGLGIYVVIRILLITPEWSIQALIALLSYIGAPTGVAIGFYSWKAKNENVPKVNKAMSGNNDE